MLRALKAAAMSVPLLFGFGGAQAQEQAKSTPSFVQEGVVSYWKPESMDVVIQLESCPQTGACGQIHWYNPKDREVISNFGNPRNKRESLCGYSPAMNFNQVSDTEWQGRMNVRGMGVTVDMRVRTPDENTINVRATYGIFAKKDVWHRVSADDKRYPACRR